MKSLLPLDLPTVERVTAEIASRPRPERGLSDPSDLTLLGAVASALATDFATQRRAYHVVKRVLDFTCALALLVGLSWLLLVIAVAIGLDSGGPILFSQQRVGRHGQPFQMFKFRTMRRERRRGACGPVPGSHERRRFHKSATDPRVTRVGRICRRTCLDELPQLWNVLRGEMSLVGPRPELPEIVARYAPWQHVRHLVSPGITGWWQINRDAQHLMHESTELDLYYVCHRSLWLDLLIITRTAGALVHGRGAF